MSGKMNNGNGVNAILPVSEADSSSHIAHVSYSCGSCGYELNLNSCNRNTSLIDAKYGKSIKRGVISFFSIDESRFTQITTLKWLPYFASKKPLRFFGAQTKLMCRNCGNYIGTAVKSGAANWDGISACKTYDMRIRSLRPLLAEDSALLI